MKTTAKQRRQLAQERRDQRLRLLAAWNDRKQTDPDAVCEHELFLTDLRSNTYVCEVCHQSWPMRSWEDDPGLVEVARKRAEAYVEMMGAT